MSASDKKIKRGIVVGVMVVFLSGTAVVYGCFDFYCGNMRELEIEELRRDCAAAQADKISLQEELRVFSEVVDRRERSSKVLVHEFALPPVLLFFMQDTAAVNLVKEYVADYNAAQKTRARMFKKIYEDGVRVLHGASWHKELAFRASMGDNVSLVPVLLVDNNSVACARGALAMNSAFSGAPCCKARIEKTKSVDGFVRRVKKKLIIRFLEICLKVR